VVELPYAIALTGGIATGKSTAANLLKLHGFHVIDADEVAHRVLDDQAGAVAELFGEEYVKGGKVDRKALGALVFSDESKRRELESLLHPLIRERILELARKEERFNVPYFIDIPLFFETKNYPLSPVAVVYAPRSLQLERLIKRDGLTQEEAMQRLDAQIDIEQKRRMADYVIDNSGDLKHLQKQIELFVDQIKERYAVG